MLTKKISKKNKNKLSSPFDEEIWKRALKAIGGYSLIIQKHEKLGYVGTSLEMPTVFADAHTRTKCLDATVEALRVSAATMLECGKNPPKTFSPKKRNLQVNIRLNNQEKLLLSKASSDLGFKGLSDFIRTSALERTHELSLT